MNLATPIFACWIIFVLYWFITAFFVKRTVERQSIANRMAVVAVGILVYLLLRGSFWLPAGGILLIPHTTLNLVLADIICLSGLIVCLWARTVLGANWSSWVTFKENHELIRSGPYQIVRHPIYSGLLLMLLGTMVAVGRLQGVIALAGAFLGIWIKLRQEEALMLKHFGPAYQDYKSHTKALIPGLL